jgi:hypothetical protein
MTTMTTTKENAFELGSADRARTGAGAKRWAGRVLSGLAILFLAFDAIAKVLQVPQVMAATTEMGFPASSVLVMGTALLVSVIAYAIPRTSVVGAVLITGYLGGAVAANVRLANPLFSHTLFPIYVAALVWGGLFLRDARVRAMLRSPADEERRTRAH